MKPITVQIPDSLYKQIEALAEREKMPIDGLVAIALSAQVSAWMKSDYLEERGKRGSWEKFQRVLTKVPDVEPEESDRLS
jgi:hypothetical protein